MTLILLILTSLVTASACLSELQVQFQKIEKGRLIGGGILLFLVPTLLLLVGSFVITRVKASTPAGCWPELVKLGDPKAARPREFLAQLGIATENVWEDEDSV